MIVFVYSSSPVWTRADEQTPRQRRQQISVFDVGNFVVQINDLRFIQYSITTTEVIATMISVGAWFDIAPTKWEKNWNLRLTEFRRLMRGCSCCRHRRRR